MFTVSFDQPLAHAVEAHLLSGAESCCRGLGLRLRLSHYFVVTSMDPANSGPNTLRNTSSNDAFSPT